MSVIRYQILLYMILLIQGVQKVLKRLDSERHVILYCTRCSRSNYMENELYTKKTWSAKKLPECFYQLSFVCKPHQIAHYFKNYYAETKFTISSRINQKLKRPLIVPLFSTIILR